MLTAVKDRAVSAVFDKHPSAAFGTADALKLMLYLFVEFTLWIIGAGIKAAVSSAPQDHRTSAELALHSGNRLGFCSRLGFGRSVRIKRLCVAAVRIVRTGGKLPVLSVPDFPDRSDVPEAYGILPRYRSAPEAVFFHHFRKGLISATEIL